MLKRNFTGLALAALLAVLPLFAGGGFANEAENK